MEMKHELDTCDEGDWTNVPILDIGWTENCIPGVKTEAPDHREGSSGRQASSDYDVDIWVPDIKEECVASSGDGSHLTSDNLTQLPYSATSKVEHAGSPVVQSHLSARHEGVLSDKHCTKSRGRIYKLLDHVKPRTSEKSIACGECKKLFSHKSSLWNHLRTHTGENPFVCEECKKVFSQKSHLLEHLRIHTGEKPFACEECKKVFSQMGHLINHMRTHTREKPFACEECEKPFSRKCGLLKHLKTHKKNPISNIYIIGSH